MSRFSRSLARLCGVAVLGTSIATCILSTTAAAAPASPCATGLAVVVSSPTAELQPACVSQQGNVLVIVLAKDLANGQSQTTPTTLNGQPSTNLNPPRTLNTVPTLSAGPTVTPTPTLNTFNTATTPMVEPDMSAVTDPRIGSYAKRQAIRDQYRGQIDEVTFNDELGDGVQLETALNDAIAAFRRNRP